MALTSLTQDFIIAAGLTVEGTSTVNSATGQTTALQVNSGAAIAKNLIVGTTATINGNSTLLGTLNVGNIATLNSTVNSFSTGSGALQVAGGVGIGQDVVVGGEMSIGSITSATVVTAFFSNNSLYSSYTSNPITLVGQQSLDNFSATAWRSAKYLVQIVDGSKIHIEEIMVFHDGTNVYKTEYAIMSNQGELGTFDVSIQSQQIYLLFTPAPFPTNMVIKIVRTALSI
jgi:hypothetical protein